MTPAGVILSEVEGSPSNQLTSIGASFKSPRLYNGLGDSCFSD